MAIMRCCLKKCESIVEAQEESRKSKSGKDVEEKAVERTHSRSRLNTRVNLEPIEKRFNRLSATANISIETITRFENIIRSFLSVGSKSNGVLVE